jgi:hypothetical protein
MIMFVASVCDVFVVLNMMCFHIHAKVPRYNQAQAHSSSPQVHAVIDRFRNHCPSSFHYAKLSIEIRALQGRNLSRAAASSATPSQHRSTLGSPQLVGVTEALHMICVSRQKGNQSMQSQLTCQVCITLKFVKDPSVTSRHWSAEGRRIRPSVPNVQVWGPRPL